MRTEEINKIIEGLFKETLKDIEEEAEQNAEQEVDEHISCCSTEDEEIIDLAKVSKFGKLDIIIDNTLNNIISGKLELEDAQELNVLIQAVNAFETMGDK